MRQGRTLLVGLVVGLLAGCVTGSEPLRSTTAWLGRVRPPFAAEQPAADVVQMQVALLERPLGDPFVSEGLWAVADEQVVALERRVVLQENGFRVCQVAGITPAGLQELLLSKRSCANPRLIQFQAGHSRPLELGPTLPRCEYDLRLDGQEQPLSLVEARCKLMVTPTLTRDGQTRVKFTPEVHHGQVQMVPRPNADRSQLEIRQEQPTESYPSLSWEVNLSPGEYVVIGARVDRPGTLGHRCFLRPEESPPVQRLLVIRTTRLVPGVAAEAFNDPAFDDEAFGRAPPLAFQAGQTVVRGTSP